LGKIQNYIYGNPNQISMSYGMILKSNGNRRSEEYHHLTTPVWDKFYYDNLRRLEQVDYAATSGFAYKLGTVTYFYIDARRPILWFY